MTLRMPPAPSCEHESEVCRAARIGLWTPELRAHLGDCPACADVALISEFLARPSETEVTVPDAGLVWWKAEIRRRLDAQEKASAPLRWAEGAVVTALLAGAAYFAFAPLPLGHWAWLGSGALILTLGAAGSWLFLAGARK